jgi:hypothetical protein
MDSANKCIARIRKESEIMKEQIFGCFFSQDVSIMELCQTTNSLQQFDIRSFCQDFQQVSLMCLDLNLTLQALKLPGCLCL